MRAVTFIQGGGIGHDQEQAVRRIIEAVGVPIHFQTFACAAAVEGGDPIPAEALESIKRNGVALKTKLLPPKSTSTKLPANVNVEFRRRLGLFASVRPTHNIPGLPSRFQGVDFHLVREITEDLYTASEHEVVPGVVQSFKIVTEAACVRFFRYTFDLAQRKGRKSVHCIHKANILKLADGLYLDCFRKVAKGFPEIAAKEMIVDNACMQLVSRPQQFEVVAAGNLYGDLLSDLGAGLVGGISATSAVNVGDGVKVYEAVYGATHDAVPLDTANPLPLVLPTIQMLRDLGETTAADRIEQALTKLMTTTDVRTRDLGGSATTTAFTTRLIEML
ncbi:isocitrate/isopropylmalate family dehydrogenase [Limnoglobus roseus]|uniref:Isocitrate dehydrogenase n=1 Tax=Limnoglobus roseus TaxID=2598579 RepID=A0A5C1AID5_9BACT|nr:isocitrate/isopropylmalate family dehydrogenase [Limnoglobus roseus]QEL18415.1 isocitrate dehydrogenase [Limnoglobus roseus]